MTRCYEYYCLVKENPQGCEEMCRTVEWTVLNYMKGCRECGVLFDNTPEDKDRFLSVQLEIGTERVYAVRNCERPEDAWKRSYDIWSFNGREPGFGSGEFEWGGICGQIVQNLLFYYTDKGDLVLDPMAGTGTTIDVCKAMDRHWRAYDLDPKREDILQNDIVAGLPQPWGDAQLLVLDPPYFRMKGDHYPTIEAYYQFLQAAIENSVKGLQLGGYLALILMDQVNKEGKKYPLIGPSYQFLQAVGLHYEHLIGLPLPTQQFQAYDVSKAREKRELLGINRQMWVFRREGDGAG